MTEGEQIRDFLVVEDVARTFLNRALMHSSCVSVAELFNLSAGTQISIRAFAERCWKQWDASGQLLFGEIPYRAGELMRCVAGENLINIRPCK